MKLQNLKKLEKMPWKLEFKPVISSTAWLLRITWEQLKKPSAQRIWYNLASFLLFVLVLQVIVKCSQDEDGWCSSILSLVKDLVFEEIKDWSQITGGARLISSDRWRGLSLCALSRLFSSNCPEFFFLSHEKHICPAPPPPNGGSFSIRRTHRGGQAKVSCLGSCLCVA